MSKKPENPPAFPNEHRDASTQCNGMTLRDYFAAAIIQGMFAHSYHCPSRGNFINNGDDESRASMAYQQADAMLTERSKP